MKMISFLSLKITLVAIVLAISGSVRSAAQSMPVDGDAYGFIGFGPLFYKGIDYPKGAYDFNVIPFVIESEYYSRSTGFRLMPVLNLSKRPEEKISIKNFGIELSVPIRIARIEPESGPAHSFYIAPGGFIQLIEKKYYIYTWSGLYLEPGYKLVIAEELMVGLGFQYGKTYIAVEEMGGVWKTHMAVRLFIGRYIY
jgi:hypothetical protein